MVEEIKTLDERKNKLLVLGQKQGYVTYEQLAEQLKGLDVDSDTLDELYNFLVEANIEIVSEDGSDDAGGEENSERTTTYTCNLHLVRIRRIIVGYTVRRRRLVINNGDDDLRRGLGWRRCLFRGLLRGKNPARRKEYTNDCQNKTQ